MGALYEFKVSAVNHNGESALSDALLVHACVAPDAPPQLERLTGDATTITTDALGCVCLLPHALCMRFCEASGCGDENERSS